MNTGALKKDRTKQLVLKVKSANYPFFMKLIRNFDFVEVEWDEDRGDSREDILANLTEAFKQIKLIREGKLETTPAKDFLNEL
jgi:hypothetical protein